MSPWLWSILTLESWITWEVVLEVMAVGISFWLRGLQAGHHGLDILEMIVLLYCKLEKGVNSRVEGRQVYSRVQPI